MAEGVALELAAFDEFGDAPGGEAEAGSGGLEREDGGALGLRLTHGGIIVAAMRWGARRKWE
jgi:hypothetical protein